MRKPKARYLNGDGLILPGTTKIVGQLSWGKDALISWANKLGLKGIDSVSYVKEKADIGSLAHSLILGDAKGEKVDTAQYTTFQVSQAENCLLSYFEWKKHKKIKSLLVESMLISDKLGYGGTPDFYGEIDGIKTLVDYKTGSIYPEHTIQLAAYRNLIEENNYPKVEKVLILGIPSSEDESFQVKDISSKAINAGWEIFKNLLNIHSLKNAITKGE